MNPTARVQQRMDLHRQGYTALKEGDYAGSVRLLEACVKEHGGHVGPLVDLASAHYLAGDMGEFRLAVERLESEFSAARPLLALESRLLTEVALAKFYEELGRVGEAFSLIENTLAALPSGHPLDFVVRCQKLRLLASFGREAELALLYRECFQISERNPDQLIECFHALILSEARLFGFESCWPRFLDLSSRVELQAADLRLVLIDLLEIALERSDASMKAAILKELEKRKLIGTLDEFERTVYQIAQGKAVESADFFSWTRSISSLGQIRLLALSCARSEAKHRFLVLAESFDHSTRKILIRKWGAIFRQCEPVEITLERQNQRLNCRGKAIALKSQSLLLLLAEAGDCAPESLLAIEGKSATPHNLESLRIALLRLNKKLATLSGLEWVVRFSKRAITLNPNARIKIV